jgi:hypothetical protein
METILAALIAVLLAAPVNWFVAVRVFRHQRLHERRSEVIGELYQRLVTSERAVKQLIRFSNGDPAKIRPEDQDFAEQSIVDLAIYWDEHDLYLTVDEEWALLKLSSFWNLTGHSYAYGKDLELWDASADHLKALMGDIAEIPLVKHDLVKRFRKELGLKTELPKPRRWEVNQESEAATGDEA